MRGEIHGELPRGKYLTRRLTPHSLLRAWCMRGNRAQPSQIVPGQPRDDWGASVECLRNLDDLLAAALLIEERGAAFYKKAATEGRASLLTRMWPDGSRGDLHGAKSLLQRQETWWGASPPSQVGTDR